MTETTGISVSREGGQITLSAAIPLLLFPVRIETRFAAANTVADDDGKDPALLLRVYPDTISVSSFESALTADEISAGQAYWNQLWLSGNPPPDADVAQAPWRSAGRQQQLLVGEYAAARIGRRAAARIEGDDGGAQPQLGAGQIGMAPNRLDRRPFPQRFRQRRPIVRRVVLIGHDQDRARSVDFANAVDGGVRRKPAADDQILAPLHGPAPGTPARAGPCSASKAGATFGLGQNCNFAGTGAN